MQRKVAEDGTLGTMKVYIAATHFIDISVMEGTSIHGFFFPPRMFVFLLFLH